MSVNPLTVAVFVLLTMIGCDGSGTGQGQVDGLPSVTTLPPPSLVASDKPVILLYEDGFHWPAPDPPPQPLEAAIWNDGRIVWREDNSLLQGHVDTMKLDELVQRLHREGVFGKGTAGYRNYGPDSGFDVVEVRLTDRMLKLESWHEGFEQNPKLVVTSHGVESLEGRSREAVLAKEPPEYLRFRRIWSDIRSTVKAWIPASGEPFTGTVLTGRGD